MKHEGAPLGTTHDANAPIVVAREAVAKVIGIGAGEVCAGVEALVADKHAAEETIGSQTLWRREATVAQEPAFIVHEVRLAIEHGRQA